MSGTGVVILVLGLGFLGGFTVALRAGPPAPGTRMGSLVFFAGRLIAAAGIAAGALNVYSAIKTQQLAKDLFGETVPFRLAEQLGTALFQPALLVFLACAITALGLRLPAATT